MKRAIIATSTALLAVIFSPFVMRHKCGLSSWPIEGLLTLACAAIFSAVAFRIRKKWQVVALVFAAPFASFYSTTLYDEWLHRESFPEWLLDRSGKEWRAMTRKPSEPNQSPQHNAGSRPSSGDSPASETPSSLGPRG